MSESQARLSIDTLIRQEMYATGLPLEITMRALTHVLGKEHGDVLSEQDVRTAVARMRHLANVIEGGSE